MDVDPTKGVITVAPSGGPFVHPTNGNLTGRVVGTVFLSAWILFSNLLIIIALLTSDKRRKTSFNLHVINLSIASLCMGGLVLPLFIDFELHSQWQHSDDICRLWLITDLMVCTVSVLVAGMMVFDRFVLFTCTSVAEGCCQYVFSAIMFILPWGLASAFVIPIYLYGETGDGIDASNGICYLKMNSTFSIVSILGGFCIPSLAAFGILVAMTLTWCVRKHDLKEFNWIKDLEDNGWQVLISWLVCLAVICMWLPFNALYLILYLVEKTWPLQWLEPSMWVAYANSGLTPLLWMVMPSIRKSVVRLCCCCCKPASPQRNLNFRSDYQIEDDANVAMLDFRYKDKNSECQK